MESIPWSCTAFAGTSRLASGGLLDVALAVKSVLDAGDERPVLVFDDATAEIVEVDFRGSAEDVARRLSRQPEESPPGAPSAESRRSDARTVGRPRLGVVSREVTLLPRHWEWLASQPGGASAALRRLVEEARRANEGADRVRAAQERAYRFMSAMAGNEPGYEEALRSLFNGQEDRFKEHMAGWPADIRDYAAEAATAAFPEKSLA